LEIFAIKPLIRLLSKVLTATRNPARPVAGSEGMTLVIIRYYAYYTRIIIR